MPPTPVVRGPRGEFIEKNLGLVHSCAGRFKGRGIEYDDLFSAGCMGLVKAYDGFDGSRGLCFSTYAVPVILGEIKKLFRDGGTVKVSRSLKELIPEESCEETVSDLLSLKSVLGTLTKEERTLIYLRFFKNKTQSETARVLHTTQVQISRKERKILAAMREQLTD